MPRSWCLSCKTWRCEAKDASHLSKLMESAAQICATRLCGRHVPVRKQELRHRIPGKRSRRYCNHDLVKLCFLLAKQTCMHASRTKKMRLRELWTDQEICVGVLARCSCFLTGKAPLCFCLVTPGHVQKVFAKLLFGPSFVTLASQVPACLHMLTHAANAKLVYSACGR